jgi:formate dehydrogenase alpha subunit
MPVSRKALGREWELERIRTICGYCGVGCEIEYAVKDNQIVYAEAPDQGTVNGPFLCTKGRYGWDYATNPDRLTQPMVRRDVAHALGLVDEAWELPEVSPLDIRKPDLDEYFIPVEWDTALDLVANRFAETVKSHGPDSLLGLASARCTNEENYLFQKFMRAVIGTNNVDHCARL